MNLKGLATGVGSLPHKEIGAALDLIFEYLPSIPFWPQLPKRDIREGMVAQFSENLPCLKVARDGLFFDGSCQEKALETFYERIIAGDIDYFKISQDFALGLHKFYQRLENSSSSNIEFIKCQVTGPFTFAASVKDELGNALLHNPVFMQVILKGLMMKALWQIEFFKGFNKKIIMFVDEPYLGCFGSAYTPINREDVVKVLRELIEGIKSENVLLRQGFTGLSPDLSSVARRAKEEASAKGDVLVGVHCCGNTDWSIFTEIDTIDIINFDAFGFLDRLVLYADNLKEFLRRGGILCWGVVPTQDFTDKATADLLTAKLKDGMDTLVKKGLDKELLLENLLLSPSCGLGTLDTATSEKILKLLSELSAQFKNLQS